MTNIIKFPKHKLNNCKHPRLRNDSEGHGYTCMGCGVWLHPDQVSLNEAAAAAFGIEF